MVVTSQYTGARRLRDMRLIVMALALALATAGCAHASVPGPDQQTQNAQRLEAVLPVLEDLRVDGFRSQDWCWFIDYPRGAFTNDLKGATACNVFTTPPQAFDDTASTDFATVQRALGDSGVSTMMVWNVEYDGVGRIKAAQFELNAGAFDRFSYLYSRDIPASRDGYESIVFQQISDHWWFLSESWQ